MIGECLIAPSRAHVVMPIPVVAFNRPHFITAPGEMNPPAYPLDPQAFGHVINPLRDLISNSIVECRGTTSRGILALQRHFRDPERGIHAAATLEFHISGAR